MFDEIIVSVPPAPSKLPPPVHPDTVNELALAPPVRFAFSIPVNVNVPPVVRVRLVFVSVKFVS